MSNSIKVHSGINDDVADFVIEVGKSRNLDLIDYSKNYRLYKIGSKKNDVTIEAIEKICAGSGEVRLVGDMTRACLFISSLREWFRTSEIISCKKENSCIIIETRNSMYELVEDE